MDIICPNCEAPVDGEITTSLRENSSAIQELFHGNLNLLFCNSCAIDFHVQSPLTFRSDDDSYIVFYNPLLAEQNWQTSEQQMQAVYQESIKDIPAEVFPEARLTLDRNQFIEKIALYLNDLDDRIIEYIKFVIFRNQDANWDKHHLYYDFNSTATELIDFTILDRISGKAEKTLSIPREVYDKFVEDSEGEFDPDEIFPGLYVQVDRLIQQA